MVEAMQAVAGRQSRFWLFAPFVLLAILAVGWTVAWFWIRHRTAEGLDAWLAHEAAAGRRWACADRAVGGYPFRIEVSCSALTLQRGGTNASLGRLLTVAQMYRPGHVIAEIGGPLRASDGQGFSVEADWRLLQVSIQGAGGVFQRASLVADDAKVRLAGGLFDFVGQARHVEAHVRPDPARQAEGAYDAALSARGLAAPALNDWTGEDTSADLELDTTIIQGRSLRGGPFAEDLERWREAGGAVQIERATLTKGARRLEAKGSFRLDDLHRPAGQLDLTAVGFEDLIPSFPPLPGGAGGLGGFLGGFLGPPPGRPPLPPPSARPVPSKLSPLPPLRLDNGRVYLGPIALPGIRLTPLY